MTAANAEPAALCFPPRATDVAHAWLRSALYFELAVEADRRGIHVDRMAALIITAVIVTGLVDDVLADAEKLLALR